MSETRRPYYLPLILTGASLALAWGILAFDGWRFRALPAPSLPTVGEDARVAYGPLAILLGIALLAALVSRRQVPRGRVPWSALAILLLIGLGSFRAILEMRPLADIPWADPEVLLPTVLLALPVALTATRARSLLFVAALAFLSGYIDLKGSSWRWDISLVVLGAGIPVALLAPLAHSRTAGILAGIIGGAGGSLARAGRLLESKPLDRSVSLSELDAIQGAGAGVLVGLASAVIVILALPWLERILGHPSNVSLIPLLRLDHPLMVWLKEKAPGTYHHSLNVGALASAAAKKTGANAILAQAGAHFHDLGKGERPDHFMENIRGENPHDHLPPGESREIIIGHARSGYDMARKKGLPRAVAEIAREHQGTTLVEYFYDKARRTDGSVAEEDYRYPGPAPRTRESALVMLADSVEALSRTLEAPDEPSLAEAVDFIFEKKRKDGQLRRSGIRRRHLKRIRKTFVRTLLDIHHQRIRYPGSPGSSAPGSPA
jgi:putative nucleotidyltransferase with HDIG domain